MRYVITLENSGGVLDTRTCEERDDIADQVIDLAMSTVLDGGDIIRIKDSTQ